MDTTIPFEACRVAKKKGGGGGGGGGGVSSKTYPSFVNQHFGGLERGYTLQAQHTIVQLCFGHAQSMQI